MTLPFAQWLPRQRWYGGRGRDLTDVRPTVVPLGADLDLVLLEVDYADDSIDRYQVVVRWDSGAEQTAIGTDAGRTGYDALTDPEVAARLLGLIEESATLGPVGFLAEPDAQWGPAAPVRSMGAEQSNTSIVFGDHAIMKAFRRLTPGINPDIELTRALAGNPHITPLLGSYEIAWDGEQYTLGMVSVFAKGSSDGWSVAERRTEDLRSAEADFGQESHRLGEAVAAAREGAPAAARDDAPLTVVLGGGHETAYGSHLGLGPRPRLGVLNLDAHFDLREAERPTSGTPFRQIAADRHEAGVDFDGPPATLAAPATGATASMPPYESQQSPYQEAVAEILQNWTDRHQTWVDSLDVSDQRKERLTASFLAMRRTFFNQAPTVAPIQVTGWPIRA